MSTTFLRRRAEVAKCILGIERYKFIEDHIPSIGRPPNKKSIKRTLRFLTYTQRKEFSDPYRTSLRLTYSEYEDDSSDSDSDSDNSSDNSSRTSIQEKLKEKTEGEIDTILHDLNSIDPEWYEIFQKQMIGDYSNLDVYNQHKTQWIAKVHDWIKEYTTSH
jgi:hypothetical protein